MLVYVLQLQQWSVILVVKLFKTKQLFLRSVFSTFELKRVKVFFVESFHFSERSSKSAYSNIGSSVFVILVSIQKVFVRSRVTMLVQSCLCPDLRAFKVAYVQIIVRSKLPMSRLSCVQSSLCQDFRSFTRVSRPCNFERTTSPCAFILSGHIDFRSGSSSWVMHIISTPQMHDFKTVILCNGTYCLSWRCIVCWGGGGGINGKDFSCYNNATEQY